MNAVLGFAGIHIRRKSQHDLSFPIIILSACHIGMQELVNDDPHLVSVLYVLHVRWMQSTTDHTFFLYEFDQAFCFDRFSYRTERNQLVCVVCPLVVKSLFFFCYDSSYFF